MSHNRDLSAAAAQFGFHSSNIGIGSEAPRYPLDVHGGNLLVSGSAAGNIILEDRSVGDSSRPFALLASNDGNFTITSANRNVSGTTTSSAERLRIDSSGRLLLGLTSTSQIHTLQVQASSGANAVSVVGRSVDDQSEITFYENDNSTILGQIQHLRTHSTYRHRSGYLRFDSGGVTEKMRLDSSGRLLLNSGTDVRIELGTTGSTGTNNRNHLRGDGANMKYNCCSGGGHFFEANGGERMRISSNGTVNIGDGYIVSNSGLHVGRNSGGTAAGESVLAASLGNDSTMVSALLTVKNAGNRGTQGHVSGSPLAKFEFNNGTAFEIDKYGRRTLQYQPAARLTIDTNGTGGGNSAQTGLTILPFNNTNRGYNTGNHFNTTNHTFTAPLAGKYLVIVSVNVIGDTILYIYKNGAAHSAGEFRSNPTGAWEHTEVSSIIEMSANDTIQAYSYLVTSSGGRKFNGGTNPGSVWDHMSIYFMG